jgi:hypothetical protein
MIRTLTDLAGLAIAATGVALALAPTAAHAQAFPDDDAFVPFECGAAPMIDGYQDVPGVTGAADLVGDEDAPAGARAVDDDFLYLRLRLDADAVDDVGDLAPGGWGFALDLDDDDTSYEILVLANGEDQTVTLASNETVTSVDDPADPPDAPPVAIYDADDHARSAAAGSSFGGDADRFLDLAVAWDDLEALGVTPLSPVGVWAGSALESPPLALDADVACHDGAGGAARLSDSDADPAPLEDDAGGAGGPRVEGGGGCDAGSAGGLGRHVLLLGAVLLVLRRRS